MIPRSTYRYASRKDDGALRQKLVALAHEQPRYGYRRLCVLLRREGMVVNAKRVRRVYRAAGLQVRRIRRRRLTRSAAPRLLLTGANQEWALDFASDVTDGGRRLRVLMRTLAFGTLPARWRFLAGLSCFLAVLRFRM